MKLQKIIFGFQRVYRTIRFVSRRGQDCDSRRDKETGGGRTTVRTPDSTMMIAESNLFWWFGMKKDMENRCSTCTACMSSGNFLRNQLPFTKTDYRHRPNPAKRYKLIFPVSLHNKYVTGEPNIPIGTGRYSKWPIFCICKSAEKKYVIKFLVSFIYFYGGPAKIKSHK